MVPTIFGVGIQLHWRPAAMYTERNDLLEAGHCPSHSHPAHACAPLRCVGELVASLLTVRNITDVGGPIRHSPQGQPTPHQCLFSDLFAGRMPPFTTNTMAPTHNKNHAHKGFSAAGAPPILPSEPTKDTPVYVISSNHGLTDHVSYWNVRPLLQLRAQCQDRNSPQCGIMITL